MAEYSHTIEDLLIESQMNGNYNVFVETGTFRGDTTKLAQEIFGIVYTVELNRDLFEDAKKRLDNGRTFFFNGDSGVVLRKLVKEIKEGAVFYLDAHWAGDLSSKSTSDSPLMLELETLKSRVGIYKDVIIIDDIGWAGKKGQIDFKPGWRSKYYPLGGKFLFDWSHISLETIKSMFNGKDMKMINDRLIIYT